jgi:hypothetical protein
VENDGKERENVDETRPEGPSQEEREPTEPTVAQLVEACRGILSEEALVDLAEIESFDDALGFAFTALIESGVEDPETFLKEKGILE